MRYRAWPFEVPEPILFVNAVERGRAFAQRWQGKRPTFCCVLAHTDTCLEPGVSMAGLTEELRPLTPAADAEVVQLGGPVCLPLLPSNPLGAPGPAGITRAALCMAGIDAQFVGAGLRVWPACACTRLSEVPGGHIGLAGGVPDARELFDIGLALGRELGAEAEYLVLGESVPGGTTTALAVLLALGYAADGRVSGSVPDSAHDLKARVAHAALRSAGLEPGANPLVVISRVGDPMQPVVAGMALAAASDGCDVLLAGGSQMLAVAAVVQALRGVEVLERVAVGTTRWVVQDPSADMRGLASEISSELAVMAANLDFSGSRHPGLRLYERNLVKEGVGAGGACIATLLGGSCSLDDLHACIDETYDALIGRLIAQ